MTRPLLVAALAGFASVCFTAAAQEPLKFKGLALGSSEQELLRHYPFVTCSGQPARRSCYARQDKAEPIRILSVECVAKGGDTSLCAQIVEQQKLSIAGVAVQSIQFTLFDGALGTISMRPRENSFEKIERALVDVYGRPNSVSTSPVTTRAGAALENRTATWQLPGGRVVITRFSVNIDESSVWYMSPAGTARLADEFEQERIRAAHDL
jgi:hypothetical protein